MQLASKAKGGINHLILLRICLTKTAYLREEVLYCIGKGNKPPKRKD
nr:MAG TPA: hypothetical protein [Caudoviricetes sp.]